MGERKERVMRNNDIPSKEEQERIATRLFGPHPIAPPFELRRYRNGTSWVYYRWPPAFRPRMDAT